MIKLYTKSVKDKNTRLEDKKIINKLEAEYDEKFKELKDELIQKLYQVLGGKVFSGDKKFRSRNCNF